jgi:hypothetical protein
MLNWEGVRHCVESNSFRLGSERLLRDKDSSHQGLTVQRGRPQKSFTYFSCTVFSISVE